MIFSKMATSRDSRKGRKYKDSQSLEKESPTVLEKLSEVRDSRVRGSHAKATLEEGTWGTSKKACAFLEVHVYLVLLCF